MSIRVRLLLLVVIVLSISISFLALISSWNTSQLLMKELSSKGDIIAESFARVAAESVYIEDEVNLNLSLANTLRLANVTYAVIYDDNGEVLAKGANAEKYAGFFQAPSGELAIGEIGRSTHSDLSEETLYDFLTPVQHDARKIGYVRVGLTDEQIRASAQQVLLHMLVFALIALSIGVVLTYFVASSVARPIIYLRDMFEQISGGEFSKMIEIRRRDEIGSLATSFTKLQKAVIKQIKIVEDYASNLEQKVEDRTREVVAQQRKLEALFAAIPIAILTIERDGSLGKKFSPEALKVFGVDDLGGQSVSSLILDEAQLSEDAKSVFTSCLMGCLDSDPLTYIANQHVFFKEIELRRNKQTKYLECNWSFIEDEDGLIESILFCSRDVSEVKRLQAGSAEKNQEISRITAILEIDSSVIYEYLISLRALSDSCVKAQSVFMSRPEDFRTMMRDLHTMKGNSRMMNFVDLAEKVHELESLIADNLESLKDIHAERFIAEIALLVQRYWETAERLGKVQGDRAKESYQIFVDDVRSLEESLTADAVTLRSRLDYVLRKTKGITFEIALRNTLLNAQKVCARLEKPAVHFEIDDRGDIFFQRHFLNVLNDIFGHLIRNSIDHGIEAVSDRLKNGKPEAGSISVALGLDASGQILRLRYQDDGAGLNIARLKQAITAKDIPISGEPSPQEVAEFIFYPGLSTADKVTMISGRGVGMDAVRALVEEHGGRVFLESNWVVAADRVTFAIVVEFPPARTLVMPQAPASQSFSVEARRSD